MRWGSMGLSWGTKYINVFEQWRLFVKNRFTFASSVRLFWYSNPLVSSRENVENTPPVARFRKYILYHRRRPRGRNIVVEKTKTTSTVYTSGSQTLLPSCCFVITVIATRFRETYAINLYDYVEIKSCFKLSLVFLSRCTDKTDKRS